MNQFQQQKISVIAPLDYAIERVRKILFEPFDISKWFTIGFCAWLAYLGKSGAGFNFNYGSVPRDAAGEPDLQLVKQFILDHLPLIISLAVALVVVGIILWVILTWLSSRGRFMFLHCVAKNIAEIKIPWHKYTGLANSLFLFRISLGLITFATALLVLVPAAVIIFTVVRTETTPGTATMVAFIVDIVVVAFVSMAIMLVRIFTAEFVEPLMFLRNSSCLSAWGEFFRMLTARKAAFTLYVLFQIVIGLAMLVIVLAATCLTCCCAGCILTIPYIGTVLALPLLVFRRAYSLYYLRQFGPAFDVLATDETVYDVPAIQ